ncbi:MAG: GNAT family N-acetyltransferase [Spirochaetia bacterium]|nr:GNAT family N-acetyltransferase [Spirochaetia bacterium]
MQNVPEIFHTKRLILRKYQPGDETSVFKYASDKKTVKYMNWPRHNLLSDSLKYVEYAIMSFEKGVDFPLAIILKRDNTFIGSTGFKLVDFQTAFIGYILHSDYWEKGYATEAIEFVYNWLCKNPEIKHITTSCHYKNQASIRILEKIGIPFELIKKESTIFPNLEGKTHQTRYYRKTI